MWDIILLVILTVGGVALYIVMKRIRLAIEHARDAERTAAYKRAERNRLDPY